VKVDGIMQTQWSRGARGGSEAHLDPLERSCAAAARAMVSAFYAYAGAESIVTTRG
jgi:hypothetical protein